MRSGWCRVVAAWAVAGSLIVAAAVAVGAQGGDTFDELLPHLGHVRQLSCHLRHPPGFPLRKTDQQSLSSHSIADVSEAMAVLPSKGRLTKKAKVPIRHWVR